MRCDGLINKLEAMAGPALADYKYKRRWREKS
jgi:hypothetical protein